MDAFPHLKILISLILGLSIARVLSGLSRRVQQPSRTEGMFAQIVWSAVLLLSAVHFWWWEFALKGLGTWHFGEYVFVLSYASLYFLMATLLYPDAIAGHEESEQFFILRRHWFFGLFALSFAFDAIDTLIKGEAHWQELGQLYPLRLATGLVIAILAMRAGRAGRIAALGLFWLLLDIGWIALRYDALG